MDEREVLRAHLREVRRFTPPGPSEERWLITAAQCGDIEARNELVERHARLIGEILNLYYVDVSSWLASDSSVDLPELVQEGYLGLIFAVDRYDLQLPWRFTTYAGAWIRKYISQALARTEIELPDHARRAIRHLKSAEEQLMQELGRQPTDAEVADRCGLTDKRFRELRISVETPLYLDALPGDTDPPDLQAQCREVVDTAKAFLPEQTWEILRRHYGIDCPPESLPAIAADLELSRQRVWEIHRDTLIQLRSLM